MWSWETWASAWIGHWQPVWPWLAGGPLCISVPFPAVSLKMMSALPISQLVRPNESHGRLNSWKTKVLYKCERELQASNARRASEKHNWGHSSITSLCKYGSEEMNSIKEKIFTQSYLFLHPFHNLFDTKLIWCGGNRPRCKRKQELECIFNWDG